MQTIEPYNSLSDYLHVLRRRKWIIAQAALLVTVPAVLFSLWQRPLYEASADVLLSRQSLAASLTGTPDALAAQEPGRAAETQANLARVPTVARRVLNATELSDRTIDDFLDSSDVSVKSGTDLLEFHVTDEDSSTAVALASEYARQFTIYRRELDTAPLRGARREIEARIDELSAEGEKRSDLYNSLADKAQELRTLEALQTANAYLVRPARSAEQTQPRPVKTGVTGFALGLLLGLGLAFLREALDTRVRSADTVGKHLNLPLLARLPRPARRLANPSRLAMLEEPNGPDAAVHRMLRTNLEFAMLDQDIRTIMVSSAVEQEGKSTTVANLAVALARSGRRVVLVDLDLHRPAIAGFFGLDGRGGLTDVALGHLDIHHALAQVTISKEKKGWSASSNGYEADGGTLEVLPAGPIPPDLGEFISRPAVDRILGLLRERADVILIDAPPLLSPGDAMALSAKVDALLLIVRLNLVRRPMLNELRRLLDASPATVLGFVVTDAASDEGFGSYCYGYPHHSEVPRREPEPQLRSPARSRSDP